LRRKAQGNDIFRTGAVFEALASYERALRLVPLVKGTPKLPGEDEWSALQVSLHLNVATCRLKQARWDTALVACEAALRLDPSNAKALVRRAQAYVGQEKYEEAQRDLHDAMGLDPIGSAGSAAAAELKVWHPPKLCSRPACVRLCFTHLAKTLTLPPPRFQSISALIKARNTKDKGLFARMLGMQN